MRYARQIGAGALPTLDDLEKARVQRLVEAQHYAEQHPELDLIRRSGARDPNREAFRQRIARWVVEGGRKPWEPEPSPGGRPYPPVTPGAGRRG